MAFMVPHVKNNYDLYSGRNRSSSSCSSDDSSGSEKLQKRSKEIRVRQMSLPASSSKSSSKQCTVPEGSRRRTVSERPRIRFADEMLELPSNVRRCKTESECSCSSDDSQTSPDSIVSRLCRAVRRRKSKKSRTISA